MKDKKFTLKALRINENLTQEEAGEKLGVTKDTISRWENGKSYPNAKQIHSIENLYGVNYDAIIFLTPNHD